MATTHTPPKITKKVHKVLTNGGTLFNEETGALVRKEGDEFVMHGPTGRHALAASCTDASRLNAHWQAFSIAN